MEEHILDARGARGLRVGGGSIEQPVIVATRGQGTSCPGARADGVLLGELVEEVRGRRLCDAHCGRVAVTTAGAVAALPDREEQEALLNVCRCEGGADPVERMRERVRDTAALELVNQLEHVRACGVDGREVRL